jgi:hypothetical protein
VAAERGVSKQALVREAIAAVGGAPNDFRPYKAAARNGFALCTNRRSERREAGRRCRSRGRRPCRGPVSFWRSRSRLIFVTSGVTRTILAVARPLLSASPSSPVA